jgi:hypothetical protein
VGGCLEFTTSPANGVLDVRLANGQFVAAYLARVGHEPHRARFWLGAGGGLSLGAYVCLTATRRAGAAHDVEDA